MSVLVDCSVSELYGIGALQPRVGEQAPSALSPIMVACTARADGGACFGGAMRVVGRKFFVYFDLELGILFGRGVGILFEVKF